jgi:hypothetical protein
LRHGPRSLGKGRDPYLSNLAGDLAINPSLKSMGCTFPTVPGFEGAFPERFGFESGLTADEYYELLRQQTPPQAGQGAAGEQGGEGDEEQDGSGAGAEGSGEGEGGGKDADHDHDGKGQSGGQGQSKSNHCMHGMCGSGGGNPLKNEPKDGKGQNGQQDAPGRTQQELDRMSRQVAEEVREHAQRNRGNVPAGLARWADEQLKPPKIPWQTQLARLTRAAVAWRDGAVDHRYDAPGRRQAGIGFGPGKPVLPRLRMPVPNVTVIIDTSGSMGTEELTEAASETKGILAAIGANITLAVCDAAVHGLTKVRTIQEACGMLKGGGGTDMRPAFDAAMDHRPRPEVIICITDGMVGDGFPAHAPPGVKVVVVLVGPFKQKPAEWCDCVMVERDTDLKQDEDAA